MRLFLILSGLLSLSVNAQKLPPVNFNHLYLVIDSSDLSALQKSSFINNEFAGTITKTTKAENGQTWTGTYIQGTNSYLEIFDSSSVGLPLGNVGVGLSVDGIGELKTLDSALSTKYQTEIDLREKQYDDRKVPWFNNLIIKDSVFDAVSHVEFWVMEYKQDYFDYNQFKKDGNRLTRMNYLRQFEKERENKILKSFTGCTFKVTEEEQSVFSKFLLSCGFRKTDDNGFTSPEHFTIHFIRRKADDRYAIAFVEFESDISRTGTVKITDHVQVKFQDHTGEIIFK